MLGPLVVAHRLPAWARTTSPIVLSCFDAAGARGVIEGANVGDTSIATQQFVEMSIELGRSIDGNVLVFVNDHILRNDGTANRGAATAAIDVDSGGPVRGRVVRVGAVSGDEVANDHVPIHVIRRSTKGRADTGVKRNARNTVTRMITLPETRPGPWPSEKRPLARHQPSRRSWKKCFRRRYCFNPIVRSEIGRGGTRRRMGRKNDAALGRIVRGDVVYEEVVAAFRGLVAD